MDKPSQLIIKGDVFFHYFRRDANAEAQRLYKEAIKLDSSLSQPYADLAYAQLTAWLYYWDPTMTDLNEALANAKQAVANAKCRKENEYYAQWILADVHLYRRDFELAKDTYEIALDLAKTQAVEEEQRTMHVDWADMLLLTGDPKKAIDLVTTAIQESPVAERWYYWVLSWAYYVDQQYENSLQAMYKLGNPRNAMRKNIIANLVAIDPNSAQIDAEVQKFLKEESDQGIVYGDKGTSVWQTLAEVEKRVPFLDIARTSLWSNHLQSAFDK
jgi:tetratricopeptide (TPR) repeat protein